MIFSISKMVEGCTCRLRAFFSMRAAFGNPACPCRILWVSLFARVPPFHNARSFSALSPILLDIGYRFNSLIFCEQCACADLRSEKFSYQVHRIVRESCEKSPLFTSNNFQYTLSTSFAAKLFRFN